MDTIKNFYSKIHMDDKTKKIVGLTIVIIILFVVGFVILKHRRHSIENPTFFLKPKLSKKQITIRKNLLFEPINGYDFTWTFWIYVDGWKYRLNQRKHIFTKGRLELYPTHCSPAVFLDTSINDMLFFIKTTKTTNKYRIKDILLNQWNHIGLAVSNKTIDFYVNGKLYKSHVLQHLPKLNHGDLHVNYYGGFNGKLTRLAYFPSYLEAKDILKQYKNHPLNSNFLDNIYNKITKQNIDLKYHSKLHQIESSCTDTVTDAGNHNNLHHNQYYSIIGNHYTKLKKNNLLKKIKINKNYTLMFSIMPKGKLPGWTNIIHSSISNKNCCNPKDRLPGIWFHSNTTKLYIVNSTSNSNFSFTVPKELPLNRETHIKLSVIENHFTLKLSGGINYSKTLTINKERMEGMSYLYVSDPWHTSANTLVKNIIWINH